jgi:hypothetical protein
MQNQEVKEKKGNVMVIWPTHRAKAAVRRKNRKANRRKANN